MEPVQLAAILAAAVLLASMLSVELGIAVALFELGLGVVVGNLFELRSQEWLDFIAAFASIVLAGTQFSLLVTVVVGSALIPTAIAQAFFAPIADLERREHPIPAEEYV